MTNVVMWVVYSLFAFVAVPFFYFAYLVLLAKHEYGVF